MKRNALNIGILIGLMVGGLAANAGAGGRTRSASHTQRATPAAMAIAALTPVGEAAGWGRVQAFDLAVGDGILRRSVTVQLFDLEPSAEYTVSIDEVAQRVWETVRPVVGRQ